MKRREPDRARTPEHGPPSCSASTSTPGPTRSTTGARMNTPGKPAVGEAAHRRAAPRTTRAGGRSRCGAPSRRARRAAAGRGGRRRRRSRTGSAPRTSRTPGDPRAASSCSGARSSDESSSLSIVVDSPPGRTIASTLSRCSGRLTERDVGAERGERLSVFAERALERENPDLHLAASASLRSPASLGELDVERADLLAAHRLAETARDLGDDVGVFVVRRRFDDGAGPLRPGRST